MYQLFNNQYKPTFGWVTFERLTETKRDVKLSVEILRRYYARSAMRLRNDHPLIQLMNNLAMNFQESLPEVQARLEAREVGVARSFSIASPGGYGKPQKRCFYATSKNSVVEYLFATRFVSIDPFDEEDLSWRELAPLRVFASPLESINWDLPRGENYEQLSGISMIGIDMVLLMMQYHLWAQDQYRKFGDEALVSSNRFLVTEALPKMFESHIEAIFINRLHRLAKTGRLETNSNTIDYSPISLVNIASTMNTVCRDVVRRLQKARRPYVNYLETIPAFFHKNALEMLKFPTMPRTLQSQWIVLVGRWKAIQLLLELGGRQAMKDNPGYIKQLKLDLRLFLNEKGYREFHSPELEEEFRNWALTISEEI